MIRHGFLALFLLCGCVAPNQEKIGEVLQSHGATSLQYDFKKSVDNLILYKEKLDLRNPNSFSKESQKYIFTEMQNAKNTIRMQYNGAYLTTYDDYLRLAFDKNSTIPERNDFLILGIYKLLWESYKIGEGHQITTLSYDEERFKKLYYYLEVIKWKIKTGKDDKGRYLFLTWQNNWQVEFQNKLLMGQTPSWEMLENLPSIKSRKESIQDPSNFNFEILLSQIIFHVKNSARLIGKEPVDVGIDAMISVVLFL
ncbi:MULTISPECIES: hypothetical protein [unclassified Sulfurospirillum]|uniref:hypothetical protein n=1 Tax=unclassified Sulfurospirillum TaxID=2618290 RepID=UPI0005082780|nr:MULTISPECIES: hypothetical protein [unclassified Sulfurospirillum]KFL33598.1 hypothetical protein JU57_10475 [Sulfurospirillum sp. SCADC]